MNSYYNNALKQLNSLKSDIGKFDSGEDTSNALQGQISAGLGSLKRTVDEYEGLAKREITTVKREKALQRVANFRDEYALVKTAFERNKEKFVAKVVQSKERQELLDRRTPYTAESTTIAIDHAVREHEFVNYAERQLDEYIATGRSALEDLNNQGSTMKSAQRRILDTMNQLGLSRSVIQYIERRSSQDKWIFLGGCAFTILCVWAMLHYLR